MAAPQVEQTGGRGRSELRATGITTNTNVIRAQNSLFPTVPKCNRLLPSDGPKSLKIAPVVLS